MVLELVRGVSLVEWLAIRKSPLAWPQACDVILQAARGLEYAHQQGLVHRDVKPENLLIRADGVVKLLDFGLAMVRGSETEFSLATLLGHTCLGTADYIAPEQSLDSRDVDGRADLYGLGCTFYFLLTGQVPFPFPSNAEKLAGHRRGKAQPVHELNPEVPERISKIIRKMMARRPENRFQTAGEVCRFLEPLAQRLAIEFDFAGGPGPPGRSGRTAAGHRKRAARRLAHQHHQPPGTRHRPETRVATPTKQLPYSNKPAAKRRSRAGQTIRQRRPSLGAHVWPQWATYTAAEANTWAAWVEATGHASADYELDVAAADVAWVTAMARPTCSTPRTRPELGQTTT